MLLSQAYGWTLDELGRRMSSREFMTRFVHWQLEPWGPLADAWRAGIVAATVVNCTPRKRGARPVKPTDFYTDPYAQDSAREELTPEQRAFIEKRKKAREQRRHSNH